MSRERRRASGSATTGTASWLAGPALHVACDEDGAARGVPEAVGQPADLVRLPAEQAEAREPRLLRAPERRLLLGFRVPVEPDPRDDQGKLEQGHAPIIAEGI